MDKKIIGPAMVQYPFPQRLASEIINMCEDEDIEWRRSLVSSHGHESDVRTSEQLDFELQLPIATSKIKPIFVEAVNDYIKSYDIDITQDEGLVLLRYSENNKYDYHVDANWTTYRVASALIYLNPKEYEGGETHFDLMNVTVNPEEPSIVIFPSNYAYSHAAMPVISGTKYIFVTWMNDLPPGFSPSILSNIAGATGFGAATHGHSH